ncbi:O-antigen ligase [Sulfuriferula sp.]|uniref:O-antigen ligase family protein n=1 Tax=Sulfuriferula sp. TaxID=2025307 RepID=UPI00272FF15C|nr:O-antigen ligase family protein [Sulfuriferula sp.]MDP2024872.1 O-antigen ligase family protein [Sulfuriferula sp.]
MGRVSDKEFEGQWDVIAIAIVVLLALSVVFGGASRDHALRLAAVELAALPLLILAAGRLIRTGLWREHRFALGLLAATVAIPCLQLVPLPPAIWTSLPGREQLVLALDLAGLQPGWAPLTVAPDLTLRSALALVPPAAMFMATLTISPVLRARFLGLCLAAAVLSIVLGVAQLASGGERLYPWETTGAGSVNGFFANRNHLASMILAVLPFGMVFGAASLRRRDGNRLALWFAAVFVGLVVVALAAIRSRAGIVLFAPVMATSLLAAWIATGRGRPAPALLLLVGATGAALTAVAVLALPPILARFETQDSQLRFDRWPAVAEAAQSYLPLGSGIGSFDAVYRSVEPLHELDYSFFNQAHNDYLETWLEAGWLGAALIFAFFVWYVRRTWIAWKSNPSGERDLQRAASIAIGMFLLHSIGDYPLRTATLAVLFALCCGLLEPAKLPQRSR